MLIVILVESLLREVWEDDKHNWKSCFFRDQKSNSMIIYCNLPLFMC